MMTSTNEKINIIQWNARGLYHSRLEEFCNYLSDTTPDILLSETHWSATRPVKFRSFDVIAVNRVINTFGGVTILCNKSICHTQLPVASMSSIEAVGFSIPLADGAFLDILSVYCPNGNAVVDQEIEYLFNMSRNKKLIVGDLNGHHQLCEDNYSVIGALPHHA